MRVWRREMRCEEVERGGGAVVVGMDRQALLG